MQRKLREKMKTLYKIIILIIWTIFVQSCDVQKKAIKNKTDRQLTEATEKITKRIGDTVTYTVPNFILKDTTIYTVNRQGTTLKTVYNDKGQISQIDCFASMIEEITRSNRELVEAIKDKNQEKAESFNPQHFIYALAVFVLLVIIGFGFLGYQINKIKSLIP